LNAFSPEYRQAAIASLDQIAQLCDGVRCDMAMLMMNDIFKNTWGEQAGEVPETDFWPDVIAAVRTHYPDFTFIAEVYWDKETDLLAQGFDSCYDKPLYDLLLKSSGAAIRDYLNKSKSYRKHLVHFIENHDEQRAAASYPLEREKAAAAVCAVLPGMWLFHDGQAEGFKTKIPVHLGRKPHEDVNVELSSYYMELFDMRSKYGVNGQEWILIETPDQDMLVFALGGENDGPKLVINYSDRELSTISGMAMEPLDPWQVLLLN
jgi:hypothetical protein